MIKVKYYHVTKAGLVEGEALGRISLVLKADYDRLDSICDLWYGKVKDLEAYQKKLELEIKNLSVNSARYLHLRNHNISTHVQLEMTDGTSPYFYGDVLDEALDEIISQKP
jgi:hypothetical protein